MSNIDIFSMAIRNLFKRKLRTFLTILGVIIGAAAIIIMLSLGIALNQTFDEQLAMMGDITTVTVRDPNMYGGNQTTSSTKKPKVTLDDNAIVAMKKIPDVIAVSPTLEFGLQAFSGKYRSWVQIKGIDASTMADFGYKVESGRLLNESDKLNIISGKEIPFNFQKINDRGGGGGMGFGGQPDVDRKAPINILEDKIVLSFDWSYGEKNPLVQEQDRKPAKPYKIKVVGVLEGGNYQTDYYMFMDIKEAQKIKTAQEKYEQGDSNRPTTTKKGYETILVKCKDMDSVEKIEKQLEDMGYYVDSMFQYLDSMKEVSASLQGLLGAIGAVSLFVAAIGIANTMVMAIYERTREIGVMKVIGARIVDIKKLFLLEASLIGFFGGTFGILLSLLVSYILNTVGISFLSNMSYGSDSKVSVIPLWLCLASLGFSSVIGLVSGYFPARRAMGLSALSAIKTE